jgi:hypothetical protein
MFENVGDQCRHAVPDTPHAFALQKGMNEVTIRDFL